MIFADLPEMGLGEKFEVDFSGVAGSPSKGFLLMGETLALCTCLVEALVPVWPYDWGLAGAAHAPRHCVSLVVATKVDRLSGNV